MRRAAIVLGFATASFALVEIALRVVQPAAATVSLRTGRPGAPDADWFEPHATRLFTLRAPLRHDAEHAGYFALGEWPFRGRPAEPAPPGLVRVLVVGDSCVYGAGLDVADSLPERLARSLDARGLSPDRIAVINLGVPGYSTLQMQRLLEEALERWPAAAVLLHPATWNDQTPALGRSDRALLAERAVSPWALRSAVVSAVGALLHAPPDPAAVNAAWEHGATPFGPRVLEADTARAVASMIARCRGAGAVPLVLVPAHPARTAQRFPRTRADAALVERVAREQSAAFVDAGDLLAATGLPDEAFFIDETHFSARACALLADALADVLVALPLPGGGSLSDRVAGTPVRGELRVTHVTPAALDELGDQRLELTLAGWSDDDPLPVVTLAGAPLLDVRAVGEHRIAGTTMANTPGPARLLVQSERDCVSVEGAVRVRPLRVQLLPGRPARLRFEGRPGDRVRLFASESWNDPPQFSGSRPVHLDPETLVDPSWTLVAGDDGTAEREAAEVAALLAAGYCMQAVVLPAGLEADERSRTRVKRWLAPLRTPR